jgi:cyclopropane fatty-acyl-phospholipid synthase-like methyltransferase
MNEDMKGVKDYYNKTAHEWAEEWYSNETMLPLLKKFIELFDIKPRILDAGCGAGYESMRLMSLGAEVVGIDISDESIKIARVRNPDCRFEVMNFKEIDDSIGVFDGIVSIGSIIHIENHDLQTVFDNFRKIMNDGGFLFVVFVEGDGYSERRSIFEINGEKYNRAFYLHQPAIIKETAKQSGFQYHDEWFLTEPMGQWKFYVFKSE